MIFFNIFLMRYFDERIFIKIKILKILLLLLFSRNI